MKKREQNPVRVSVIFLGICFLVLSFVPLEVGAIFSDSANVIADIAQQVERGVVNIHTEREVERATPSHPFLEDPFFRHFFPDFFRDYFQEEPPILREGLGSGFIVDEEGYIVTNEHVITEASKIKVILKDSDDKIPAEVVWRDYSLDLAIIKIATEEKLNPIPMGNSAEIRPGDWAIAIGNPLGFEHTVTIGVISALGRPIQIPTERGEVRYHRNLIQTDAAINPGNSGGPLLNIEGEVIGINTAVAAQARGIGFAIPVNEVKFAIEDIKNYGEVRRPWVGVNIMDLNHEISRFLDIEREQGVVILEIIPDSPAEKAGLKPYDIIVDANRKNIANTEEFLDFIREREIEERIMLRIIREGEQQLIFVEIEQRPQDF